jgi:hypothetical protein
MRRVYDRAVYEHNTDVVEISHTHIFVHASRSLIQYMYMHNIYCMAVQYCAPQTVWECVYTEFGLRFITLGVQSLTSGG